MSPPRALLRSPWFLGALLFAACYWTLDLAILRAGLPHPLDDIWEDGIIARLLVQGEPWRTIMIYPPLWSIRDPHTLTVPVLIHGPLLPLMLAMPVAWLGPGLLDQLAWLAALFALLTAIPLFRLTARHYDQPAAAGAVGLFTVCPIALVAVHHSLSVMLGAFLMTAALDLLARPTPRAWLAGVLLGAGYLVRPEMLLVAPVLALLAASSNTPGRHVIGFVTAFVACASWWWWHHLRVIGNPFFNLTSYTLIGFWGDHPGTSVLSDFNLTPERWPVELRAALPTLWMKWVDFLPHALKHAAFTPSGATGWLVVLGLCVSLARPLTRRLASAAFVLALIPVGTMTLTIYQRLYLAPFLPLYALGSAVGAQWLFGRLPGWAHRPRAWIGALALMVLPTVAPSLRTAQQEGRLTEQLLARERAALAAVPTGPAVTDRPMMSDRPDFVAWTTGRATLWMPLHQYEWLYPADGPIEAERPYGLPARRDPADTWFHEGHWSEGRHAPETRAR